VVKYSLNIRFNICKYFISFYGSNLYIVLLKYRGKFNNNTKLFNITYYNHNLIDNIFFLTLIFFIVLVVS